MASSPPPTLQLLPAGMIRSRVGIAPTEKTDLSTTHCPLTTETTNLIGQRELGLMKSTGILVNVARGAVVDHDALLTALKSRRIAGAALDVTLPEPLPRDHALLELENIIIAPHLGSAANRTRRRMEEMTVQNLNAGLQGEPLPWRVV